MSFQLQMLLHPEFVISWGLCVKRCSTCPFEQAFLDTTELLKCWPTESQWELFHRLSKGKTFLNVGIFLLKELYIDGHPPRHANLAVCWQLGFFGTLCNFWALLLKNMIWKPDHACYQLENRSACVSLGDQCLTWVSKGTFTGLFHGLAGNCCSDYRPG